MSTEADVALRTRDRPKVPAVLDPSTADLVAAAAGGDRSAWEQLVERYERLVFSVARSFRLSTADAADVSQTVWLRFAEHLDRLSDPERAGSWLATTTRRECLRLLKRSDRVVLSDDLDQTVDLAADVDERVLRAERQDAVRSALARIPERCQRLLGLLVADERPSYRSISAELDLPVGSIGPTRARCLDHLRREMGTFLETDLPTGDLR